MAQATGNDDSKKSGDVLFSTDDQIEEAREAVLALTGLDIARGKASEGTRNVTYVLADSVRPSVIRITPSWVKPLGTVQGELMFVDYLGEHMHTVCKATPFDNRLVNVISVGGQDYYVVVSRKANGMSPGAAEFDNERIYELYGSKFAELHAASRTASEEGFHFQRPEWEEAPGFCFEREDLRPDLPADVRKIMLRIRDSVSELPRTPETFGMIHGDASPVNSFLDWEDIWLFDFDDCCYHYFMYDVAAFMFQGERFARQAGATFDPLACLRRGYEQHNVLPGVWWTEYYPRLLNLRKASAAWLIGQSRTPWGKKMAAMAVPTMNEQLRSLKL